MAQYINKASVVAEIDDWRDRIKKGIFTIPLEGCQRADATFEYEILGKVRGFLDNFGIKEVDLEDEVDNILESYDWNKNKIDLGEFAKHFFELGLKLQKGENKL